MLLCSRPSPSVIPSFLRVRLLNLKSCSVDPGTSQIGRRFSRLYLAHGYPQRQGLLSPLRQPSNYRYIHPRGPTKPLPVPGGKFHVLFFGGDEFSCYTLRKLHEAKGKHLFYYRFSLNNWFIFKISGSLLKLWLRRTDSSRNMARDLLRVS